MESGNRGIVQQAMGRRTEGIWNTKCDGFIKAKYAEELQKRKPWSPTSRTKGTPVC